MRHSHKQIIRLTQIVIVAVLFFVFFGLLDAILFFAGEISLVEAIEGLEAIAGVEGLTVSAYLYKMVRKGMWEEIVVWLMRVVEGNEGEKDADEKLRLMERERLKIDLKKLRRK